MHTKIDAQAETGVRDIKLEFETVVRENSPWLLGFVKSKVGNPSIAEDLTQEILLKAYRAYESYCEDGRLRHWLMRIAQNHLRNYFSRDAGEMFFSLDASVDEDDASLYDHLAENQTPEELYLQKEMTENILEVIARLPNRQRQVITYRFIEDRKFSEIADIMQIPEGSVKSTSHYALGKIRKELGLSSDPESRQTKKQGKQSRQGKQSGQDKQSRQDKQRIQDQQNKAGRRELTGQNNQEGDKIMDCKEIYKYLFIYANNTITDVDRAKVEEHIKNCKTCADVVSALQRLIPQLTFALEDEMTHFLIDFPQLGLSYSGVRHEVENYEELNRLLEEWDGNIPEDSVWLGSGFGSVNTLIGTFDNEGNEIKMVVARKDHNHTEVRASYIRKMYCYMWEYNAYIYSCEGSGSTGIRKAKEAPGLYYGTNRNTFGRAIKTGIYQAIPGAATNVRMKRGNGVIDCGTYKFPYVDRYVTEDESIMLDYSFNLKE